MTEDEMVGWHQRLDGHEFEQALRVGDRQGSLACCSPWGHKMSDMTLCDPLDSSMPGFPVLHHLPEFAQTLKSLLQCHNSKASVLWRSASFIVQLSHLYMTTGKTTALTRRTCVGKVMSLLFNKLPRLVITFLPRSKGLLISWLPSPYAVILEPKK